ARSGPRPSEVTSTHRAVRDWLTLIQRTAAGAVSLPIRATPLLLSRALPADPSDPRGRSASWASGANERGGRRDRRAKPSKHAPEPAQRRSAAAAHGPVCPPALLQPARTALRPPARPTARSPGALDPCRERPRRTVVTVESRLM